MFSDIAAIILAAGQGERFRVRPKCMLRVRGESLLERQLRILRSFCVNDIKVVIGDKGCWDEGAIKDVKEAWEDIAINEKCLTTQRPYSLHVGLQSIHGEGPIIVLDGDLIFESEVIKKLLKDKRENVLLTQAVESSRIYDKGCKIISLQNGRVWACHYGISSYELFSGIFKVGKSGVNALKYLLTDEKYWNTRMSHLLNELSKRCPLYSLCLNTKVSVVPTDLYETDASLEGEERMVERVDGTLRKSAIKGRQKLMNEVEWILSLPEDIKSHFPKIMRYDLSSTPAYYDMKFCPYPNLKSLLLNRKISLKKSLEVIKRILDFMFFKVYTRKCIFTPIGYTRYCYLRKAEERMRVAKGKSKLLDKVMGAPNLLINGQEYENIPILLKKIGEDIKFLSVLEPPYLSLVHGDFKFDNILVDLNQIEKFILIDPRGKSSIGLVQDDLISDIAKLFTSCHGFYDLFYEGLFDLNITEGNTININLKPHSNTEAILEVLTEIAQKILRLLPSYPQIRSDKGWRKRLFFTEAMLMVANAPFHLVRADYEHEKLTIGLYARGLQLLSEFLEQHPLSSDPKYNIININTLEDYEMAKEYFEG